MAERSNALVLKTSDVKASVGSNPTSSAKLKLMSKSDYICGVPFTSIELHDEERFLCCASWLTKFLPKNTEINEAWESKEADDIRDSMLDGSYRYCDDTLCPYLSEAKNPSPTGKLGPLHLKDNLPTTIKKRVRRYKEGNLPGHSVVQFSFDRSCNLECPSCRVQMFIADSKKIKEVELTIEDIENKYSNVIQTLYITGSGDPFISVGFRNFLRNFKPEKYPKLDSIHLHTNATKWNRAMWASMPNIHKFVSTCEISIDAGTLDTYENKTRINGKWNELIDNLRFINTLANVTKIKASFVVQRDNYKEMDIFYNLMLQIFGKKVTVFYGKITNWGTFTEEEFKQHNIFETTHPEHTQFLEEVNKVVNRKQVFHNLHEFVEFQPIKKTLL